MLRRTSEECNYIISSIGMVFDDELGEPGTYFYVSRLSEMSAVGFTLLPQRRRDGREVKHLRS